MRTRRTVVRALLVAGVGVLAVVCFTAYQAFQARDALNEANVHLEDLTAAVSVGDSAAAQESLYDAQQATLTAQRNTSGPAWWLASKAPVVGDDVDAVQTVTDVVDDVAQGVLPTLVDASTSLSPDDLQPSEGAIQTDDIARLAPLLANAHASLVEDLARVQALEPDTLLPQLSDPVTKLEEKLLDATTVTASASKAAQLLPSMLGSEGKRTYLVLFQNNAEIRATGGIPGAVATITADHGSVSLESQGAASALGTYEQPVLPLSRNENALFTSKLGVYPADVTFTPNFPRTAQLAQAMWKRETGVTVDGVLSTDPVALSYLLGGTGSIAVSSGVELTADNAVQLLLNDIYLEESDTEQQNAFFADAAKSVFESVMSGQGNPQAVLNGLLRAAEEHRTLVWSDHNAEQSVLATTTLSGALSTKATPSPQIGVYLNDGTGSKMDYYLDYDVELTSRSCGADGSQSLALAVTMTSSAPVDAENLPVSVKGPGFGAEPGSIRTNVLVYAPVGGEVASPMVDGRPAIAAALMHAGRQVSIQTVDLAPGQSRELTFDVESGVDQRGVPTVRTTPGMPGSGLSGITASACS